MTAQIPEKLLNNMQSISFDGYSLFGICVSQPQSGEKYRVYPFRQKGDLEKCVCSTACWRGYVSAYELHQSGELSLVRFEYLFGRLSRDPDPANETLTGDFWLEFRTEFFGDKLFVPFEDGKIVVDQKRWIEDIRK